MPQSLQLSSIFSRATMSLSSLTELLVRAKRTPCAAANRWRTEASFHACYQAFTDGHERSRRIAMGKRMLRWQ